MRSRERGFSLVELLVVIAILSILSALVLVAVDPATRLAQARDAKRKQGINQIANALAAYLTLRGSYPASGICYSSIGTNTESDCSPAPTGTDWVTNSGGLYDSLVTKEGLLKTLPVDPLNNTNYFYRYGTGLLAGGTSRSWIGARLEKPPDPAKPIYRCADYPSGFRDGPGCVMVADWTVSPFLN